MLLLGITFTTAVSAKEAIIKTDNLNVRNGPGIHYDKIDQLHTGDIYPIIQTDNEWVELQLKDRSGWITTEYITITEDSNEADNAKSEAVINRKSITIQQDNTQLRNGPSTDNDIIQFVDKGTVFDVVDVDNDWYEVTNEEVTGFVLKQFVERKTTTASNGLKNKTIVIDAGHGGQDVGAIGASGTFEKDITSKTAQELKQELTMLGAEVILTRMDDEYISLNSRTSLANMARTDAFISIHYNSVPELSDVTGIGTYYYQDQNKKLANLIQQEIIREVDASDRGIAFEDFQVLRQNFKPAVLVELGFISNQGKEELLLTNAYQKKLVSGMVNGLEKYFAH